MYYSPEEFKQRLRGTVALITTPFTKDDELDEFALREQIDYVKSNFKGEDMCFLAGGSIGEFYALSDAEWVRFTKTVVDQVKGEFPVMIGSGRAGTRYTIELTKKAQELGADAVTIINPYYHMYTEEALYRHIDAVARSVDIGIVTYDNHVASKITIPPHILHRMSKIKNVIANKENTLNAVLFKAMLDAVDPRDMVMITGGGDAMFAFTSMYGSQAYVSLNSVVAPHIAIAVSKAGLAHDPDSMAEVIKKTKEINGFCAKVAASRGKIPTVSAPGAVTAAEPVKQSIYKMAQNLIGLHGGRTRAPMEDNLTGEEIDELRGILRRMGCSVVA